MPGFPTADTQLPGAVGAAGDSPPALTNNASGLLGWLRKIVDSIISLAAQFPGVSYYVPTNWATNTVFDARYFSNVEIEVRTVTTPITIYRDLIDGTQPYSNFYDQNGNGPITTTISSNGVYTIPGGGYIKYTGAATTVKIRASQ